MSRDKYGFYFEEAGRSPAQGAIDPEQEHFKGSSDEEHLARETGQNSSDAHDGSEKPVVMEYELAEVPATDIPGLEGLIPHIEASVKASEGQSGYGAMERALEVARSETLSVLRISDFNTKGLTGDEFDDRSPLSRLTRGNGGSADDGVRGGSFGIGSAVGKMASEMSTVLYRSLSIDDEQTVFAGHCRLSTHVDATGARRHAEGNYMKIESSDIEYLRPAPSFSKFAERTKPGTDTFILGFRVAEDDPGLVKLRNAFIDNFLVAIHRGRLVVRGITRGGTWTRR